MICQMMIYHFNMKLLPLFHEHELLCNAIDKLEIDIRYADYYDIPSERVELMKEQLTELITEKEQLWTRIKSLMLVK